MMNAMGQMDSNANEKGPQWEHVVDRSCWVGCVHKGASYIHNIPNDTMLIDILHNYLSLQNAISQTKP